MFTGCYFIIEFSTANRIYREVEDIPHNKVGLVLGTARHQAGGGINPYYQSRIDATIALYKAGKISFVLVSGDNGSVYYNEPNTIKKDLIAAGIPENRIYLDYAGFRTLDSMIRARIVFGLDSVTVISQEFHTERALFIASKKDLYAIGYSARDVEGSRGLKVHLREYFARVKVFLDLIFNTQPRFYGKRIEIE
ncbi:MAG: vancomycin high temperature exclusion protein [Bacteroidetes bacterium]|nr:MAG: vancomycin high temperature exclusion protein [Bacteroidota bacterium]